jgi:autotransporter-associated beta strand protein
LAAVIPSWLRLLVADHFKALTRRRTVRDGRRHTPRPEIEALEDRAPPALATWTGAAVPDPQPPLGQNQDPDPRWLPTLAGSNVNWSISTGIGTVPAANDDVVFPVLPAADKTIPAPPPQDVGGFGPALPKPNSINNIGSFTFTSVSIQDSGYRIADSTLAQGNNGVGATVTPLQPFVTTYDGVSEWDIPLRIANGAIPTLQIAVNPKTGPGTGAALILGGAITETVANSELDKTGSGILQLGPNANPNNPGQNLGSTYSGPTLVEAGILDVQAADALGTTTTGTTVLNGATLRADAAVNAEPLTITGLGVNSLGALSGNGTWTGPIQLVGNALTTQVNIGSTGLLTVSGPSAVITSSGVTTLDKVDSGVLSLQNANTYQADTLVSAGTLRIGDNGALAPGFTTTVNPSSPAAGATLELSGNRNITSETTLFLSGDGVTRNPAEGPVGALAAFGGGTTNATWAGPITLLGNTSVGGDANSTLTLSGSLGGSFNLTKVGSGTLVLPSAELGYTGTSTVRAGTVRVNGNLANSPFVVQSGATLAGAGGTVGATAVNGGGVLSPGGAGAIATLNVSGTLTLAAGSTFFVEVNSVASLDKVNVTGTANLGNSTLNLNIATASVGSTYTFLQTTQGITGIFHDTLGNPLPDGSTLVVGGRNFTIHYNAGGNNAVTVTAGLLASGAVLTSNPAQPVFGQPATFTVTLNPVAGAPVPTGAVKFFVDGTQWGPAAGVLLANNQAHISVPADVTFAQFQGGPHTITATYAGDVNYAASSAMLQETVAGAATTITLAGAPNPGNFGQAVTFTAVVTAASTAVPAGVVTFLIDGAAAGVATLDAAGRASFSMASLATGVHSVTAAFKPAGANFLASSSSPLRQVVGRRIFAVGAGVGKLPVVKVFDASTRALIFRFFPFGRHFPFGVRVAIADVNGDGILDIITRPRVVSGPKGRRVKVFDGATGRLLPTPRGSALKAADIARTEFKGRGGHGRADRGPDDGLLAFLGVAGTLFVAGS